MLTADYPRGNGDDDGGDVNCKKRRFEHGTLNDYFLRRIFGRSQWCSLSIQFYTSRAQFNENFEVCYLIIILLNLKSLSSLLLTLSFGCLPQWNLFSLFCGQNFLFFRRGFCELSFNFFFSLGNFQASLKLSRTYF